MEKNLCITLVIYQESIGTASLSCLTKGVTCAAAIRRTRGRPAGWVTLLRQTSRQE
jgi:hypothetical protein